LGDIYYVIFRHKWKIIILSMMGFVSAVAFYFLKPPPYQSQAELLIQYVPQAGALTLMGSDQRVIVPDSRGEDIINSEIKIMTSLDLAAQAVANLGATGILAKVGGGSNVMAATSLIRNNLLVEPAGKGSSVIVVTFLHPDQEVAQQVLQEIINDYLQKHREIHSLGGQYDDELNQEKLALSLQLNDTEQQLASLKNKANIISLEDSKKGLADQISKIQGEIFDAQAQLVGYQVAMKPSDKLESVTNATLPAVPSSEIDAYKSICASLDAFRKREQDYLLQGFTSSNSLIQEVDVQIAARQKAKDDFQTKYPQIADLAASSTSSGGPSDSAVLDPRAQAAGVTAFQAKISAWNAQLDQLEMQATNLNSQEPAIAQLEQTRAIQEANYQNLATSIEKRHIDQALDSGKTPNIKTVQSPSRLGQNWNKTHKTMAMLAFSGIFAGLAWAFIIEFVLDRSFRRPTEIETKLKVPLLLSIPNVRRNGHAGLLRGAARRRLELSPAADAADGGGDEGADGNQSTEINGALPVVSLERDPAMHPYCEALRDRLIVYFEVRNLTHKPKLVAVTSASRGAGVSTLAAGLAASLSETGDGNVLLVDMNVEQGAAQQFHHGNPGCGLDAALNRETKEYALVRENLYVVNGNANSEELPRILPKRFSALVPKLKASDYDYIIFDMPPVSQTSLTSRLARFMDMVLLIVESEKSDREVVQQANTWLAESGATVGAVLNKTRQYIPARLHKEFLNGK
jgi:polysaccharide biosynthesis transport protein